eukprot:m.478025 g.478025  ORF g.478025 m.478025 type:complete len:79 (+) comp45457_c0_seq1:110-346(+)
MDKPKAEAEKAPVAASETPNARVNDGGAKKSIDVQATGGDQDSDTDTLSYFGHSLACEDDHTGPVRGRTHEVNSTVQK